MKPQPVNVYIHTQGLGAAIGNVIFNPLLAWLGNRSMEWVTLFGDHSIVIDTAITSIVASLLVTLFASSGVHRDLKAGRLAIPKDIPGAKGILLHLPQSAWTLGLTLGATIAIVLVPLALVVFHLFSLSGLTFAKFAVIKAVYTGLLGFVVARWVILRQLTPNQRT